MQAHQEPRDVGLGGFETYPRSVHLLFRSYAKYPYIEQDIQKIDATVQQDTETDISCARRLRISTLECGGVFSETELITHFVRCLNLSINAFLAQTQRKSSHLLTLLDSFEQAAAVDDSHQALYNGTTKHDRVDWLPSRGRGCHDVNHILNVEGQHGYRSPPSPTPSESSLSTELLQNDVGYASSSTIVPSGTHLMVLEEVNAIAGMDN